MKLDLDTLRKRARDRMPKARGSRSWYAISKADGDDIAVVRIYGDIGWSFLGDSTTAEDFVKELDETAAPKIRVEINSMGGDVFDAVAIYNALRSHPAHITTRVDGMAASAASIIVQAGDHRVMLSAAQQMIHEAWGFQVGPADEMRAMADLLDKQSGVIADIYASRSGEAGGDHDHFLGLMAAETYLTDEEAVDEGLADEVVDPPRQGAPKDRYVGPPLQDQISEAMDVVTGVIESAERVAALRAEQGKELSQRNQAGLDGLTDVMERLRALRDAKPTDDEPAGSTDLQREYARFVALTQGVER